MIEFAESNLHYLDRGDEDELLKGEIAGGKPGDHYLGFFLPASPHILRRLPNHQS